MTTKSQDRLLGVALVSLLAAFGGDLLGTTFLLGIGVASFFLAVAGLLALMTASLIVGVNRISGPDMRDPVLSERTRLSTTPSER